MSMTFRGFAARNLRRCQDVSGFNHALGSWSLSDWMTAVMGELGEAANVAKKLNRVRDGIRGNEPLTCERCKGKGVTAADVGFGESGRCDQCAGKGFFETNDESQLRQNLADEIADTFIYLDLLAQSQGFSLEEAVASKFERTSQKIGYVEPTIARAALERTP